MAPGMSRLLTLCSEEPFTTLLVPSAQTGENVVSQEHGTNSRFRFLFFFFVSLFCTSLALDMGTKKSILY